MLDKALEKLSDEMAANSGNQYIQFIGDYLTDYVRNTPADAEKIMQEGKTIAGSLSDMRKEAEKHKQGNMAILTPNQGFDVVAKYFGIGNKGVNIKAAVAESVKVSGFDVSLDDFLK